MGIVNGHFRFSAGDGGDTNAASDSDTAVISLALPDSRLPLDGEVHVIVAMIYTQTGTIRLYFDGRFIAEASSTSKTFEGGQWTGSDSAGFGIGASSVASGGTLAAWPAGSSGSLQMWDWTPTSGMDSVLAETGLKMT